jgi:hypothetical protein
MMPVHDALDALSGLSNIARRTTLLCYGRPSPSPDDLKNINVMVLPPSKGSYVMEVAVGIANCGLLFGGAVATNVAANLITPSAERVLRDLWNAALGKEDFESSPKIEPWFDAVAEVSEKLHPSFNLLAGSVGQSAETVSLFEGTRATQKTVATIDLAAKLDLSEEITDQDLERFAGRIRQLNDNTHKGIVVARTLDGRSDRKTSGNFRFWVPNGNRTGEIVAALAQNLAENNSALVGLSQPEIEFTARRVTTTTGRTKRLLIDEVRWRS